MLINKIDFLSPPITLFHLERRTHTSKVGGFLVIVLMSICTSYIVFLFYDLTSHKKITALFHKKFEFEAGYYSFNSSSIFHFIQIFSPENGGYFDKYDSRYIRAYTTYVHSNFPYENLYLYDHWVFDTCRRNIDDKELEPYLFENVENFTNGVCIRYYYNSTEKKYYSLEDNGFFWPHLEHGIAQRNNIYLTTIVQKCSNDSIINEIFGKCPPQKEIDDYISKYFGIYLYFTDMQVDPTNYTNPVQKYLQVISSGIGNSNNFVESYIHFSPLRVRTKLGSMFGTSYEINSFYFDFNRKGSANNNEKYFTITKYYHLMQNNVQIYERKYNNFFDIFAEIGGIVQFMFYLLYWLNYAYNKYIIAYDTNSLFFAVGGGQIVGQEIKNTDIKFTRIKRKSIVIRKSERFNINLIAKENKFKTKEQNSSEDANEKIKNAINDKLLKKLYTPNNMTNNLSLQNKSNTILLKENNQHISCKLQKLNNPLTNKIKINQNNEKEIKKPKEDILNKMLLSRGSMAKMQHKKRNSFEIFDPKLQSLKYFSYIDYLKTLLFRKEKESYNFIRIFRKHLLSEEHLFKSHLKIIFLEKQLNSKKEENISFLECFNEL